MKTPIVSPKFVSRCAITLAAAFAALVSTSLRAAEAQAAGEGQKTHILFVGTDLSVKQDGTFYHVVRAGKKSLEIERDGKVVDVKNSGSAEIKILRGVKLSRLSASISNVKTDSIDREAARAQFEAMRSAMLVESVGQQNTELSQARLTSSNLAAVDPSRSIGGAITAANIAAAQAAASTGFNNALASAANSSVLANTFISERMEGPGSVDVEMSFDVASPEPLENAYLIVVANYGAEDKVAHQVSARELKRIDGTPQRITVNQSASMAGLPFKKFDVALFANGQEVATNLSDKQIALTSDQAYQFFMLTHIAAHAGATEPPIPMLMLPRSEFRRQMESVEANQPIFVKVDKSGSVLMLSGDAKGESKLPSSLEVALQNVRFVPALQNGSPVEGTVKFTLAQLAN